MALTDVTRSPYCLVNMGGISLGVGKVGTGTAGQVTNRHREPSTMSTGTNTPSPTGSTSSPAWAVCRGGDMDIGYPSELDPTWNDSSIALILSPEAIFV